jgi:hypothetical protein
MAIQSAKFKTSEVTQFLSTRFPYAATCFAKDTAKHGEFIPSLAVSNWFQKYLPTQTAYHLFKELQSSVTQSINFTDC